jgi:endonuclease YncB( thermonuclease family)
MKHLAWLLGLYFLSAPLWAGEVFTGLVTHISDGDTLWVQPDQGEPPRKLRLQGIDAPELCQSGGEASRDELVRLVGQRRVNVTVSGTDDYGRDLARVELAKEDVAAIMVRTGQAWSYRWRNDLGPYAAQEALAREAKVGLFSQAKPELPRDFRRRHGSCYPTSEAGKPDNLRDVSP